MFARARPAVPERNELGVLLSASLEWIIVCVGAMKNPGMKDGAGVGNDSGCLVRPRDQIRTPCVQQPSRAARQGCQRLPKLWAAPLDVALSRERHSGVVDRRRRDPSPVDPGDGVSPRVRQAQLHKHTSSPQLTPPADSVTRLRVPSQSRTHAHSRTSYTTSNPFSVDTSQNTHSGCRPSMSASSSARPQRNFMY